MRLQKRWSLTAMLLLFLFSCSGRQEMVYVDPTWEPEILMAKANEYLQDQDYDHAFEAFSVIHQEYPASRLYTDAVLGIAYIYGKTEQYEKQMDILLSLVRENIVPSKIPAIYNQIAEFYEKTSVILREINPDDSTDLVTAIDYYTKASNYPLSSDSISKSESLYKIALIQFQLGKKDEGLTTLNKISANYPNSPWAIQAQNFLNTYKETGILPGILLDTTDEPLLPELEKSATSPDSGTELVPESPVVDSVYTTDTLESVSPDSLSEENKNKSILDEIPNTSTDTPTNLDSLLNEID